MKPGTAPPRDPPPAAVPGGGPWTLRSRGADGARSWVTVACTHCGAVPWDEPLGMTASFTSVEQAREELPRAWGWLVTGPPGGPEQALCPACAARLAAGPPVTSPGPSGQRR